MTHPKLRRMAAKLKKLERASAIARANSDKPLTAPAPPKENNATDPRNKPVSS
jgi:hypothetical protein